MKTQRTIESLFDRMTSSVKLFLLSLIFIATTAQSGYAQLLNVTPINGVGPVGSTHCVIATIFNGMNPVPGIPIAFNVLGANPSFITLFTDQTGTAQYCYVGNIIGQDNIHVFFSTQQQSVTFNWISNCNFTNIDDGDPCTIDACDPNTGLITHTPSGLMATATPHTPINCYGESTCVDVTAVGGVTPYSNIGSFCNILSGQFDMPVTDAVGCVVDAQVFVMQPPKLTVNTSAMPTPCGQSIGSVSANAQGGAQGQKNYLLKDSLNTTVGIGPVVSPLPAGTYTVTVTDANGCTTTGSAFIGIIGVVPNAPGPISGPPGLCKGQNVTFCVPIDPNATSYEWDLPFGISGSSTTHCISFNVGTSYHGGSICVRAKNACGFSDFTCKSLPAITTKLPKPMVINGPSPVCTNANYSYCISGIPLTEVYNWTITGNGGFAQLNIVNGQGTTCVVIHVPAGYNGGQTLKVNAQNCMGKSADQSLSIKIIPIPAQPGNITGPSAVCKSQLGFYSIGPVNNATTYNWSINSNVLIAGGQGSTSVAVDFILSNANSALLSVVTSNTCGSSLPRTKVIAINPNCRMAAGTTETENIESGLSVYPNPTHNDISLDFVLPSDGKCRLQFIDYSGRVVKQLELPGISGPNHFQIDLTGLSKGVYFLVFDTADKRDGLKVFVE